MPDRPARLLFLVPACVMALAWLHVVAGGASLQQAARAPMASEAFVRTVGQSMDDPWLHHSALRIYFHRLRLAQAPPAAWADSRLFAWRLWHEYQYAGTVEIMIAIQHAQNNRWGELRWASLYAAAMPLSPQGQQLLQHARVGHARHQPLRLVGSW